MTNDLWPEGSERGLWASLDDAFEEADEDGGLVRFVMVEPGAVANKRGCFTMTLGEWPLNAR